MADVRITDPDDLTAAERQLADRLATVPPADLDQAVSDYVDHPSDDMRHVLMSGDLVQDVVAALERLQAAARAELDSGRRLTPAARQRLERRSIAIRMLREELMPYVNLSVAAAADKGTRRRAEKILAKLRYAELRPIMRDLDGGMSEADALAAAKARAAAAESGE